MAKRSPISGYNHNVRYRGLIFHVQTEDSGQATPHLFTHLFYEGVIISTRKLVYDADSAADAIKGLMQAQHKVVMKDLKRGAFDDKIDVYLAGTEGLLPRSSGGEEADGEPPRPSAPDIKLSRPEPEHASTSPGSELQQPARPDAAAAGTPPESMPAPMSARTKTAERTSGRAGVRPPLPEAPLTPDEIDLPMLTDAVASVAAAVAAANATGPAAMAADAAPSLELAPPDAASSAQRRGRMPRDTLVEAVNERPLSDGVPGAIGASPSTGNVGPDRRSAVGAASLPPALPVARPSVQQTRDRPQMMSRPLPNDDGRADAVDAADALTGAAPDHRGQYAQHKRMSSQRVADDGIHGERDRSAPIAVPAGLGPPGRAPQPSTGVPQPGSGPVPRRESSGLTGQPPSIPHHVPPPPLRAPELGSRPNELPRTLTPARVAAPGPMASRVNSPQSGGVVMTRPAVIVGAPPKPATPPKVRKAREEEGRGFGQGLISEKSLDEVILAYLSEDATNK